jgi:hypothetical protein
LAYEGLRSRIDGKKNSEEFQNEIRNKLYNLTETQEEMLRKSEEIANKIEYLSNNPPTSSNVQSRAEAASKIMEEVDNVRKNNKFIEYNLNELIDKFKEFLSLLSIEQICILINITTSLFILTCIFSIFTAYSGNYLINKLDLSKKYPKLTRFIELRVKFQHYYILINLILVTLSLFFLIYVNYITLTS